LRRVCRSAGEGLGREDAGEAWFRSAAEMVEMWFGLDLPAWVAPYALRDARLGYVDGYERALVSGELLEERTERAARARWGGGWGRNWRLSAGGPQPEDGGGACVTIAGLRRSQEANDAHQALQHAAVTLRPADQDGPAREGDSL
jgi:hypothetical protein